LANDTTLPHSSKRQEEPTVATTTTADLRERLRANLWPCTYNGIPIWELGDSAELTITIGHVDPAAFARAYDAYLRAVGADPLTEETGVTVGEFAASVRHRRARIIRPEQLPAGEFGIEFTEHDGDVDVTVGSVDW